MKICVFGDSNATEQEWFGYEYWGTQLRKYLPEGTCVFNLGICDETSRDLLKRLDAECKIRSPDTIIISIGTNDSKLNNKKVETSSEEFETNINKIINICKNYTNKITFIGLTPVNESKTNPVIWDKHKFFTNNNIKEYNEIIEFGCQNENVLFLNVFDTWIKMNYEKLLDKEDGLHLNEMGHNLLFESLKNFLKENEII